MQGFGVNTYKWVNAAGETRAGQVPLAPEAGRASPGPRPTPRTSQGEELGVHTKDLYEAIERGEYPAVGAATSR